MEITLTPEHEALVERKLKSGKYNSSSEIIIEALLLLEERDRLADKRKNSEPEMPAE